MIALENTVPERVTVHSLHGNAPSESFSGNKLVFHLKEQSCCYMFIGITGPQSSGKHIIAQYLVEQHNFQFLSISSFTNTFGRENLYNNVIRFTNVNDMQTYVTERWQENFVTCDVDSRDLWTLK
jgi:hypothetical protein